jgi:hypothetical protein
LPIRPAVASYARDRKPTAFAATMSRSLVNARHLPLEIAAQLKQVYQLVAVMTPAEDSTASTRRLD